MVPLRPSYCFGIISYRNCTRSLNTATIMGFSNSRHTRLFARTRKQSTTLTIDATDLAAAWKSSTPRQHRGRSSSACQPKPYWRRVCTSWLRQIQRDSARFRSTSSSMITETPQHFLLLELSSNHCHVIQRSFAKFYFHLCKIV